MNNCEINRTRLNSHGLIGILLHLLTSKQGVSRGRILNRMKKEKRKNKNNLISNHSFTRFQPQGSNKNTNQPII
jgi:hypothetical protein